METPRALRDEAVVIHGEEQGALQGLPLGEAPVSTGARASEMLGPRARFTFIKSLQASVFSRNP